MNEDYNAIQDMYGYLMFSMRHGVETKDQFTTLVHDIAGLAREDECFSPRTSGYAKYAYMDERMEHDYDSEQTNKS